MSSALYMSYCKKHKQCFLVKEDKRMRDQVIELPSVKDCNGGCSN